mmetsp:Transcript_115039/g.264240  ORF Transcript_115039/g.264240 Transcript_115039/m.264240 type:complete len:376 (-) Transcript_115039:707-1834(-)
MVSTMLGPVVFWEFAAESKGPMISLSLVPRITASPLQLTAAITVSVAPSANADALARTVRCDITSHRPSGLSPVVARVTPVPLVASRRPTTARPGAGTSGPKSISSLYRCVPRAPTTSSRGVATAPGHVERVGARGWAIWTVTVSPAQASSRRSGGVADSPGHAQSKYAPVESLAQLLIGWPVGNVMLPCDAFRAYPLEATKYSSRRFPAIRTPNPALPPGGRRATNPVAVLLSSACHTGSSTNANPGTFRGCGVPWSRRTATDGPWPLTRKSEWGMGRKMAESRAPARVVGWSRVELAYGIVPGKVDGAFRISQEVPPLWKLSRDSGTPRRYTVVTLGGGTSRNAESSPFEIARCPAAPHQRNILPDSGPPTRL